jgi:hypothetical protein
MRILKSFATLAAGLIGGARRGYKGIGGARCIIDSQKSYLACSYKRNVSGYFLLTNRKCPDNILSVGTFPIAQQEMSRHSKSIFCCRDISCWAVGIFPVAQQEISRHAKSVGTFPIGVVGTFLVGCVGISTGSVSGHFYRPQGPG